VLLGMRGLTPSWRISGDWAEAMSPSGSRLRSFESLRRLPSSVCDGLAARPERGVGPDAQRRRSNRWAKVTGSVSRSVRWGAASWGTRGGELVDIEGNPRSPIKHGTLCPKDASSRQLVQRPRRPTHVLYRRPGGTKWGELELEQAMDLIAERGIAARESGW
jgi:formate dehydrogenase major subunit